MKKTFTSKCLLQATLTSVLGFANTASAIGSDATPDVNTEWEKCYGVVKAGENDCSSLNGSHGCGGLSTVDGDLNEYIWLPKGSCQRIANGVSYESKKSPRIKKWCEKTIKNLNSKKKNS